MKVTVTVNGRQVAAEVPDRTLLVHFVREQAGLTATNVGCDTSSCGACTVLLDGRSVKSCTLLAAQADGRDVLTVEGLRTGHEPAASTGDTTEDAALAHPVQRAFRAEHALQCGFCTPGMVMAGVSLLAENPDPTEDEIRTGLKGNLCRCTGYHNIVRAVLAAVPARGTVPPGATPDPDGPGTRGGSRGSPPWASTAAETEVRGGIPGGRPPGASTGRPS